MILLSLDRSISIFQTSGLEYLTSYDEKTLQTIADLIHNTLREVARVSPISQSASNNQNNKFSSIIDKYAAKNFFSVSTVIVQFYRDHFIVN